MSSWDKASLTALSLLFFVHQIGVQLAQLILMILCMFLGHFVDSVDQDLTAQNVQSDLGSTLNGKAPARVALS